MEPHSACQYTQVRAVRKRLWYNRKKRRMDALVVGVFDSRDQGLAERMNDGTIFTTRSVCANTGHGDPRKRDWNPSGRSDRLERVGTGVRGCSGRGCDPGRERQLLADGPRDGQRRLVAAGLRPSRHGGSRRDRLGLLPGSGALPACERLGAGERDRSGRTVARGAKNRRRGDSPRRPAVCCGSAVALRLANARPRTVRAAAVPRRRTTWSEVPRLPLLGRGRSPGPGTGSQDCQAGRPVRFGRIGRQRPVATPFAAVHRGGTDPGVAVGPGRASFSGSQPAAHLGGGRVHLRGRPGRQALRKPVDAAREGGGASWAAADRSALRHQARCGGRRAAGGRRRLDAVGR